MTSNQQTIDHSTTNFTAIFNVALNKYKKLTKQDLETHPFSAAFENSSSSDFVLDVFRKQARAFDEFRKGDNKLMEWLTPLVNILFAFSGTLEEGIGLVSIRSFHDISALRHLPFQPFSPAKTIFTGIGVLLGVSLFPHSSDVQSHNIRLRLRRTSSRATKRS